MQKQRLNDIWITIMGILLTSMQFFVQERGFALPKNAIYALSQMVAFAGILGIWLANLWIVKIGRRQFPTIEMSAKRIVFIAAISLVVSTIINTTSYMIGKAITPEMDPDLTLMYFFKVTANLCILLWVVISLYESSYRQFLLSIARHEKNELLRTGMQQQVDTLRNKINPHFLFNSLNTLSALIYNDKEKAEVFVEELSTVYRYLLRNNQDSLSTVGKELDFIQSYLVLLQTRFGDGLQSSINVDEKYMNAMIPTLSLQLLTENAVKHNIVSSESPLHLQITAKNGKLIVCNNLQLKKQSMPSEKMGLQYIITKYSLFDRDDVVISEEPDRFVVGLPLIETT